MSDKMKEALKELVSIVKIHSNATKNNFAWAELQEAEAALTQQPESGGNLTVEFDPMTGTAELKGDGVSNLKKGQPVYTSPQPTPQVPEYPTALLRNIDSFLTDAEKAPDFLSPNRVGPLLADVRQALKFTPSIAERREWVNMEDLEPENDSIVWTRWTGMPDQEGRTPVTGEAAKSLTPYVRSLCWLDTGLRLPEPPVSGGE